MCLEYGALSICDIANKSPLLNACEWGNLIVITSLVNKGHSLETPDKSGKTPLKLLLKQLDKMQTEKLLMIPLLQNKGFYKEHIEKLLDSVILEKKIKDEGRNENGNENGNDQKLNTLSYIKLLIYNEATSIYLITSLTISITLSDLILDHLGSIIIDGNLKELYFETKLTDDQLEKIVNYINQQNKLRALSLYSYDFTNTGLIYSSKLMDENSSLSKIKLVCNHDEGTLAIAKMICKNISITSLDLTLFNLNDNTITEISYSLEKNQSITELSLHIDLTINQIKILFLSLEKCKNFQSLSINDFTSSALPYIAQYIKNNITLEYLKFTSNSIWNDKIEIIAEALISNPDSKLKDIEGIKLNLRSLRKILKLDKHFQKVSNSMILKFLKELKINGTTIVKRTKLIFAGNGEVGKSTLIRRLKENKFEENSQIMTDGVDISYFMIGDIEVSVFDFAGQPEYEHTHSLFFDTNSIYLLLYSPRAGGLERLKIYQQMIINSTPNAIIIFVTTRADEARLTQDELDSIKESCPNIIDYIPIDSKSGTGISELESIIIKNALMNENTIKTIPTSFERFRVYLQTFGYNRFSVTYEEIKSVCLLQLDIKGNMIDLALDLFLSWGYLHRLSNGDYVLHPQQLANVMSCVFTKVETTKSRIGDVSEGVLRHTNDVLDAVWYSKFPTLSKSMWRCTNDEPISPFISLLYQAGLAFELFDSQSKPIGASLVPGLLALHPCGFQLTDKNLSYIDRLCQLFIPNDIINLIHPQISITFKDTLPTAFVGRLQVKMRRMATLGGAWKRGCCLVIKDVTKKKQEINGPQTTDQVIIKSLVIIYQSRDNHFDIISAGEDTSSRSAILSTIMYLIQKQFPSIKIDTIKLIYKGREYSQDDIIDNLTSGFIYHRATNENINIGSLRVLFPNIEIPLQNLDINNNNVNNNNANNNLNNQLTTLTLVNKTSNLSLLDESNSNFISSIPIATFKKFKELEMLISSIELNYDDLNDDGEFVYISDQLLSCIPNILQLMGIKYSKSRGLSTLWVHFEKGEQ